MSDAKKVMEEANAIDPDVQFSEEACEGLTAIPSMFRGMALKNIVSKAKEEGVALVDKAFIDKVNAERG